MSTCIWHADGTLECPGGGPSMSVRVREGFLRDPKTDPNCKEYGCAAGRSCTSVSDCANGLSCKDGVCTRVNPFEKHDTDTDTDTDNEYHPRPRPRPRPKPCTKEYDPQCDPSTNKTYDNPCLVPRIAKHRVIPGKCKPKTTNCKECGKKCAAGSSCKCRCIKDKSFSWSWL